jgi:hypothetical protein
MRHASRLLTVIGVVLLGAACVDCGGPTVERALPASWIGTEKAKLAVYMGYAQFQEEVPAGVRHETVRDEAVLLRTAGGETCIRLTERTSQDEDEPLDELRPRCAVAGRDSDAVVTKEAVTTQEYPFVVTPDLVNAQGYTPSGAPFNLAIKGKQEERMFRVVERTAEVCCAGSGRRVELHLRSNRMQYNHASFTQTFSWTVQ